MASGVITSETFASRTVTTVSRTIPRTKKLIRPDVRWRSAYRDGEVVFYNMRTGKTITQNRFKIFLAPINHLNLAYAYATRRNLSLPPVYRTDHHSIDDDRPLKMEPQDLDEIPMHGREPME